jgi:hypothetical protein
VVYCAGNEISELIVLNYVYVSLVELARYALYFGIGYLSQATHRKVHQSPIYDSAPTLYW